MSKIPSIAILATILILSVIGNIILGYMLWDAKQPEVLAIVNQEKITKDTLADRLLARNKEEQLNAIVEEILIEQQAKKEGITVREDEITKRLQEVKESLGGDELFQRFLTDSKLKESDLKDSIRHNLYLEKIVLSQVDINDTDVVNYFEANRELFQAPELRLVSHIFNTDETAIKKAYAELVRGEKFTVVAEEYSLDPGTNKEGGLIGWMSRADEWVGVTETAFQLGKGSFSAPKKSEYGWHIVYVSDIREASNPEFKDIKDKVGQSYVDYIVDKMRDSVIQSLKSYSNISINI